MGATGFHIRLEERDGCLVPVGYYDGGPDEDGFYDDDGCGEEDAE